MTYIKAELNELRRGIVRDQGRLLSLKRNVQTALTRRAQAVDQLDFHVSGGACNSGEWVVSLGAQTLLT